MNLYRCKFILVDYDNLESNMFVNAIDEQTATQQTKEIYEKTLAARGIPKAKYTQTVTLSSEEEANTYLEFMKKRNNSDRKLN